LYFQILQLLGPLLLIALGFIIGRIVERRHLRSLDEREELYRHIVTTNLKSLSSLGITRNAQFVDGHVVIGSDHFKTTMVRIRKIFGGRLRSVESLMMRARRESLLRLLEQADQLGATHILNIRYESASIGGGKMISAEVHAYGTAVTSETTLH
jgi:uncharacterized protein YbjQ (UPF0145 family)